MAEFNSWEYGKDASDSRTFHSWEEFTRVVQVHVGSSVYDDLIEALTRLNQFSSIIAYITEFELFSNWIRGVSKKIN